MCSPYTFHMQERRMHIFRLRFRRNETEIRNWEHDVSGTLRVTKPKMTLARTAGSAG